MTTEQTPFSATTVNTTQQIDPPTVSTIPQEVSELVGQGKKYATAEDALKSVPHAQNHIKTLTEELQAAKAELEKRKTAEQLLDEIKSGIKPVEPPSTSPITSDSIAQVVEQTLAKKQQETIAAQNITKVTSSFSEKFGDKAEATYIALAVENGLTVQQMNLLSASSPAAVLKLAGLADTKVTSPGKVTSTVNTDSFQKKEDNSSLTSRVRQGASTKDLVNAWHIAGQKVGKQS